MLSTIEQRNDLRSAGGGQLLTVNRVGNRLVGGQVPEVHGRQRVAVDLQLLAAALGQYRMERHRVIAIRLAKQERATAGFGTLEHMVHRLDHRMAGAEVGAQGVMAAGGGLPGAQVGVDVGAAKGVDRLLGVADQEQAAVEMVFLDAVDAVKDAVLHRVGVLEFIDQGHRELLADHTGQTLAPVCLEGGVEADQHVVKPHLGAATFLFLETFADPAGSVLQHRRVGRWQGVEAGF